MKRTSKLKLDVLMISGAFPPWNFQHAPHSSVGGVAMHVHHLAFALRDLTKQRRFSKRRVCEIHLLTTVKSEDRCPQCWQTKDSAKVHTTGWRPNLTIHWLPGINGHFQASTVDHEIGVPPLHYALDYCMNHCQRLGFRPDVIHAHDFDGIYLGKMLKAAFGIPLVATLHHGPKREDHTRVQRSTKDCFLSALSSFPCVDRFVAPSRAYKERLLAHGLRDVEVIPHGIPLRLPTRVNQDLFTAIGLQPDQKFALCPTRLEHSKNPDTLIRAIGQLQNEFRTSRMRLVIAGTGEERFRSQMLALAQDCGVGDLVTFGQTEGGHPRDIHPLDMPRLYSKAEFCVIPSRIEGFGQVLIEAWAFKRPCIVSNVPGLSEAVRDTNAILFDPEDAKDLAHQIQRLLSDGGLSKRLGQEGYGSFRSEYTVDAMARRYLKLYLEVAGVVLR